MMKLTSKATVCAALSVAFFLGAAAPVHAQATPIASGHGAYVGQNQQTRLFAFAAIELGNGSVLGRSVVIEPSSHALVSCNVTSYMLLGNMVLMAGPITTAINAPPQFVVGSTCFFAANDNGSAADGITGLNVVPLNFGNLSIQQIIALIGPPPAVAFSPLLVGNIRLY